MASASIPAALHRELHTKAVEKVLATDLSVPHFIFTNILKISTKRSLFLQ